MTCFYLFVEGVHDCAAIYKILHLNEFNEVHKFGGHPQFIKKIIPNRYPFDGDTLERISPAPTIMYRESDSKYVAIKIVEGDSRIAEAVNGMINIRMEDIEYASGVGVILDADNIDIKSRVRSIEKEVNKLGLDNDGDLSICIQDSTIAIRSKKLRFSIYVMPNNKDKGTLEDVLIDGAVYNYKDLLEAAERYMSDLPEKYYNELGDRALSKRKKALVGFVSNVLKPGKANQASIRDCDWFTSDSIQGVENHRLLHMYLNEQIDL